MLTVEIHSAAGRFCRRISTRARASSLLPPCARVGQEQRSCGIGSRTAAFRRPSRRSPAHAHHWIAQRAESLENADRHVEICILRSTRRRSPLECTALRLGAGAGCRRVGSADRGHARCAIRL